MAKDIALLLLESGIEFTIGFFWNSPLHWACDSGNDILVRQFLEMVSKETLDVESTTHGTPLYRTAFSG